MKVKINDRLITIGSFVEDNSNVIDVGCDHALLGIYLMQNNKNINVIASDINEGPLKQAKENIKNYNLEDKIKVKLGNGIDTIEKDTDTIIISGMGGLNIVGILKYKTDLFKNVDTLILSPNNDVEKMRKEICKLGFHIEDEKLIKDKNHIYVIIKFKRGKKRYKEYEYLFGPVLIRNKESLFLEHIDIQKKSKEKLLKILPKKFIKKRFTLKRELKIISKIV